MTNMDVWFLRYEEQQTEFFVILHHFLHFNLLITQEIKNLKNNNNKKKTLTEISFLHMCPKNHNHMTYSSWDMECSRHNLGHFLPFYLIIDHDT